MKENTYNNLPRINAIKPIISPNQLMLTLKMGFGL